MLLPAEDATLFLQLYPALLGFGAGRLGGIEGVHDLESFHVSPMEAKGAVRDQLYENLHLLGTYVNENPDGWSPPELELVAAWHQAVRGTFIALRDLKKFTLLLDENSPPRVYGVLGLTTELTDIVSFPLPVMLKATLLPWKGQIVCDGLIAPYSVILGSGIVRNAEDAYRQAKAERGIITSLEETGSTEAEPAVQRRKRRRTKVRANLLLDADIVEHFKQEAEVSGKRPDTLMNAALRQMIEETVSDEDFSRAFDELFIGPRRRKRRRGS